MTAETHRNSHDTSNAPKAPPSLSAAEKSRASRGDGQGDATDAAEVAAAAAGRASTQTMDAMQSNIRMAAEIQQPALELLHDQSRRAVDVVAQFTSACHKATESTMGDIQALAMACTQFGCGVQEWQHAFAELTNRAAEHTIRAQQVLLGCHTPAELAHAQQDLYREAIGLMVQASNDMLELNARISQEAVKPLRGRAQKSTQAPH